MSEYNQGICQDGAAVLKDGRMMTIEEILEKLSYHDRLVEALDAIVFSDSPGNERMMIRKARALLAELENQQ